ncbi:MAG TPA: spermidine synthase [Rhodocyclaceae bacterium]|nr:spermidine synthase [Rhodocyclaceae bacterium]
MATTPIDIREEDGVRYLHFGSDWIQGAMRIKRPLDLELDYTREMMAGLLMRDLDPWPHRILLIGLGAASLAKFCYWKLPQAKITVVEIEPAVVSAARHFFKLPENDKRLDIVLNDGANFIAEPGPYYDYILVDGYDENARVGALDSLPFYQACSARLSESGLIAINLFGRNRKYRPMLERLSKAFDSRALAFPSCDTGNVIAFAARGEAVEVSAVQLRDRAKQLAKSISLDLRPTVTRLEQAQALVGGVLRI